MYCLSGAVLTAAVSLLVDTDSRSVEVTCSCLHSFCETE